MFKRYAITFSKDGQSSFLVQLEYETEDRSNETPPKKYRLTIAPNESPMEMNWFGKGFLLQSIYELEEDKLRIAHFGIPEETRPESFKYNGKGLVVWSFKREAEVEKTPKATLPPPPASKVRPAVEK